jgi:hypothetical protein
MYTISKIKRRHAQCVNKLMPHTNATTTNREKENRKMVTPTNQLDQALANLWANTRPKATDVLIRNLRAHAYSYAMDDAHLCEDLRQAIGRLEHPSTLEPKPLSIIDRLDDIVQELYDAGYEELSSKTHDLLMVIDSQMRGTK